MQGLIQFLNLSSYDSLRVGKWSLGCKVHTYHVSIFIFFDRILFVFLQNPPSKNPLSSCIAKAMEELVGIQLKFQEHDIDCLIG